MANVFSLKAKDVRACTIGLNKAWYNLEEIGKGVQQAIETMHQMAWVSKSGDQFVMEAEKFQITLSKFIQCGKTFSNALEAIEKKETVNLYKELVNLSEQVNSFANIFGSNARSIEKQHVYLDRSAKSDIEIIIGRINNVYDIQIQELKKISNIRLSDFSVETEAKDCIKIIQGNQEKLLKLKKQLNCYEDYIDWVERTLKSFFLSLPMFDGLKNPWTGSMDHFWTAALTSVSYLALPEMDTSTMTQEQRQEYFKEIYKRLHNSSDSDETTELLKTLMDKMTKDDIMKMVFNVDGEYGG